MSRHSEACCRVPPVVDEGYVPKGRYIDLYGLKTYVTGPPDADNAILAVYDIFGFFPQILQGADILATGGSTQVFMPDFFNGNPAKMDWYPPLNDEHKAILSEWFKGAQWSIHKPKLPGILQEAAKINSNIKAWGIMGYCWGGKMASIVAGDEPGLFKAAVQTSPAQVDADDAARVKIPTMMLASGGESEEEVKQYEQSLTVINHVERFDDQVHGFMSARADLKNDRVKAEYERGYALALGFFHEHL
ncbi:Alpha/Beta hydrolase protein [Xylaria acuta]|nr:Alpha/Beta hydrolase protein [Xylaria acuta]